MSLAQVVLSIPEFDQLWEHLTATKKAHRSMHLRMRRGRRGEEEFSYLHAMFARSGTGRVIEGMASGPDGLWHYTIRDRPGKSPQINVGIERPVSKEIERKFDESFVREIEKRIGREQRPPPERMKLNYKSGEYYLQRGIAGPQCSVNASSAVASGTLDRRFVAQLPAWRLRLVRGH